MRAYDPEGMASARRLVEDIDFVTDPYSCADGADALVIVTEWDEFRALDLGRVATILKAPVLIDLRNIYPPDEVARHGFVHVAIGRSNAMS